MSSADPGHARLAAWCARAQRVAVLCDGRLAIVDAHGNDVLPGPPGKHRRSHMEWSDRNARPDDGDDVTIIETPR